MVKYVPIIALIEQSYVLKTQDAFVHREDYNSLTSDIFRSIWLNVRLL